MSDDFGRGSSVSSDKGWSVGSVMLFVVSESICMLNRFDELGGGGEL